MTSAMLPRSRIFAGHVLACTIFAAIGSSAHADSTPPDPPRADQLIGSWLTTYQVAAFGGARPILLSFTRDGIVIETDTPTDTGGVVLSNGHGAWKETGKGTFAFTYRKDIFNPDPSASAAGLDKTDATVTVSPDGAALQMTLHIQFTDTAGNVTFSTTGTGTATRIVVDQNG
jgi:hypothetical protein